MSVVGDLCHNMPAAGEQHHICITFIMAWATCVVCAANVDVLLFICVDVVGCCVCYFDWLLYLLVVVWFVVMLHLLRYG